MAGAAYHIDYGLTPKGQMYERHQAGSCVIIRTTADPERFLRWVIASEINTADMIDQQIKRRKGGNEW